MESKVGVFEAGTHFFARIKRVEHRVRIKLAGRGWSVAQLIPSGRLRSPMCGDVIRRMRALWEQSDLMLGASATPRDLIDGGRR